jgi:hypothetical protein
MTITLSEHPCEGFVEITVSGRVTEADMNAALPQLEAFIKSQGKIRLVEVIAGFEGYDLAAVWPGVAFDYKHLGDITHAAVVCDKGWMGPVSRIVGAVLPVTVRTFSSHDRDAARAWAANPEA